MQKKYLLGGLGLLLHLTSMGQAGGTLDGIVQNNKGVVLPGALVSIKGTYLVDGTDEKGQFHLKGTFAQPVMLVVSYVGYETQEFPYNPERSTVPITLIPSNELNEVIVAASRVEENLGQVPVTVDKLNARQVANITTPDLVTGLARLQGVDVSNSSMLSGSFTTRGFSSTSGERVVQLADYFPTLSPGLSFTIGNLSGLPTLDIASVEIVHGAASALYGANALNGVMLLNSKNPFFDQGLTVRLRGGTRNLLDGQFRYAVKLSDRIAFKISGGALEADDFVANNRDALVLASVGNNSIDSPLGYNAVNRYGDLGYTYTSTSLTGKALVGKTVYLPGFSEADLLQNDTKARNYKVSPSVSILLANNVKATAAYFYTNYAGIFQNTARYALKNAGAHQGRLSVEGSNWVVRGFVNREFSGKNNSQDDGSYNLTSLGTYLQGQQAVDPATGAPLPYTYAQRYFTTFGAAYDNAIATGSTPDAAALKARNVATTSAPLLQPGTDAFNRARTQLINDATPGRGAHLITRSTLAEANGQYHFSTKVVDLLVGGAYRQYILDSDGSLFQDEKDGPHLHNYEYGGYGQASKSFLDNRLKLAATGRLDHFKNFGSAFSPRGSVVYSAGENKQHNFRASFSRAFRSPTQVDQYVRLEQNQLIALGNVGNGFTGYQIGVLTRPAGVPLSQYALYIPKLKLEQVNTFEVGYRAQLTDKLNVDAEYYYNIYNNFVATKLIIANTDGSATTPTQLAVSAGTGFQNTTRIIAVSANVDQHIRTQGAGLTLTYTVLPSLTLNGNYSYTELLTRELFTDTYSLFNTPKHKFNLGFDARPLNSRLDLNVNYRWNSSYYYESTFAVGTLPVGQTFDAQVGYTLPKLRTTLQAGGTNLFNTSNFQAYGAASYGRIAYLGLLFNLPK